MSQSINTFELKPHLDTMFIIDPNYRDNELEAQMKAIRGSLLVLDKTVEDALTNCINDPQYAKDRAEAAYKVRSFEILSNGSRTKTEAQELKAIEYISREGLDPKFVEDELRGVQGKIRLYMTLNRAAN